MNARKGDRVRLLATEDSYTGLQPGTEGTVQMVDDLGTVHVQWDTGEQLGLIDGRDAWQVLSYHREPDEVTVHQNGSTVTVRVPGANARGGSMYFDISDDDLHAVRDALSRVIASRLECPY